MFSIYIMYDYIKTYSLMHNINIHNIYLYGINRILTSITKLQ